MKITGAQDKVRQGTLRTPMGRGKHLSDSHTKQQHQHKQIYERLGENVQRPANVRIIAATNRDLKKRVADGTFREDLYFRLNVISVEMPPLRALGDNVLRFANHYAKYFAGQCGRRFNGFSAEAVTCIRAYPWPGNLRELRNTIEREDFPAELRQAAFCGAVADMQAEIGSLIPLQKLEEAHLRKVLQRTSSLLETAQVLGIDQATLYRKRKRIGL